MKLHGIEYYRQEIESLFYMKSKGDFSDEEKVEELHRILHGAVEETKIVTRHKTVCKIKKKLSEMEY